MIKLTNEKQIQNEMFLLFWHIQRQWHNTSHIQTKFQKEGCK